MKYYNLDYYVDKLKKGEHFSLARYGDGELLCMWGKKGGNSNGCAYTPELREALLDSMKHWHDPKFIYGLQRVLPQDKERVMKEYRDIEWHDSEFLSEAVANGELYPLIEQLKKMPLVVIGNESISSFFPEHMDGYVGEQHFIEVPKSNAFEHQKRIIETCLRHKGENRVYLFSCGMAANAFISELHGKVNGWLIDVGHIWDPFVGNMSRCDLEGKTKEDIVKNLCPKE